MAAIVLILEVIICHRNLNAGKKVPALSIRTRMGSGAESCAIPFLLFTNLPIVNSTPLSIMPVFQQHYAMRKDATGGQDFYRLRLEKKYDTIIFLTVKKFSF